MRHPDLVQHLNIQLDPAVTFDHIPASHRGVFAHSPLPTDHIFARIPFSALIGNAISNDGDALFPAIALTPRAAVVATVYSAIPALIVAYGFYFLAPGFMS